MHVVKHKYGHREVDKEQYLRTLETKDSKLNVNI